MQLNQYDPLPLTESTPLRRYKHMFATGDRVSILATGQKGKISNIDSFGRIFLTTDSGFVLECRPEELEPEGFSATVQKEADRNDPLPLGPFTKSKKFYRLGETFKTGSGEVATVTEIKAGKVLYTFAGGHGEMLQG